MKLENTIRKALKIAGLSLALGATACTPSRSVDREEHVQLAYEPFVDNYFRRNVTRLQDIDGDGSVDCVKFIYITLHRHTQVQNEVTTAFADYRIPEAVESCKGFPQRTPLHMSADMAAQATTQYDSIRSNR